MIESFRTIGRIAKRASGMAQLVAGVDYERCDIAMDLHAVSATCPLRLDDLLAADDRDFAHDVFGIRSHLDRGTGLLGGGFRPRFAARV